MSDETRRRLNRAIWMERARYAGIGLAILGAIGLFMVYENFDLAVTKTPVAGVVETIEPLVAPPSAAAGQAEGLKVGVKLEDGRHIHVIAMKSRDPHVGDAIEVIENKHGTGRVTHSMK
jgi:anaerobic C4-dicarboxylate transporter